jgi:membrane-associated phospholipid phosphatase
MRLSESKLFFMLALLLFTIAAEIARGRLTFAPGPTGVDVATDAWMKSHHLPALTAAARGLSQAGTTWSTAVLGLLLVFVCWRALSRALGAVIAVGISASILLCAPLKAQFACGRPDPAGFLTDAKGFGFPSQHALIGTVAWGFAIITVSRYHMRKPLKYAAIAIISLLVSAIAASRVYLAVHWLSDVLFGLTLALGWLSVAAGYEILIARASLLRSRSGGA